MKDAGKIFKDVKVYTDPEVPPNTIFLMGNFISENPRRSGKLIGITKTTWRERLMFFLWVIPLVIFLILLFIFGGRVNNSNIYPSAPVYTYQMYHGVTEE